MSRSGGIAPREIEKRYAAAPVELRAGTGQRRVGGYASVFRTPSQNLGGISRSLNPGHSTKRRRTTGPA
jgi:hypothetical protein